MWPSRFITSLPPTPGIKPRPLGSELPVWLASSLAPSIAIEQVWHACRSHRTAQQDAPTPPARRGGILATWRRRIAYRRELVRLLGDCPHMIRDIGLTREAAEAEIVRPFWRGVLNRGYSSTSVAEPAGGGVSSAELNAVAE